MVKVVLCRFVKAQIDGISLRNALRNALPNDRKMKLQQAGMKAEKIAGALLK